MRTEAPVTASNKTDIYRGKFRELSADTTPGRAINCTREITFKGVYEMEHFRDGMKSLRTKLRVRIHRDFYDYQSYARVERWDGQRWAEVDHLPYNQGLDLAENNSIIYVATSQALFIFNASLC